MLVFSSEGRRVGGRNIDKMGEESGGDFVLISSELQRKQERAYPRFFAKCRVRSSGEGVKGMRDLRDLKKLL